MMHKPYLLLAAFVGVLFTVLLCGLVAVLLAASPKAMADSRAELMDELGLSGYPAGVQAPEFTSCCYRGRKLSLAGLRGMVVLLNFWTTWCTECRKDMPALEQLHRDFGRAGLRVVGMNIREGQKAIDDYANALGITFPLLSDRRGRIQAAYGVLGTPTTFVIDREGRAAALAVGGRRWGSARGRNFVQQLLVGTMQ